MAKPKTAAPVAAKSSPDAKRIDALDKRVRILEQAIIERGGSLVSFLRRGARQNG